jgi:phosphoribosylformylglycinamidine synthase II
MTKPATSIHRELGLTDDEHAMILEVLGRDPTAVELAMYSVMWSEHCSYKSSRIHLRRLPSDGPDVLVGPGENAGVVDVGDGVAIALRIESHNHPSAVEPYQGAATGVGGILRDVFTMGARPIAIMDPLFFGSLDDSPSRFIFDGVVRGISGYGNSVGVPTVGGQLTFSDCYRENPLVNVFCLGLLPKERLVLGRASGVGNLVVLLGSLTGRDGIGGVSVLASAGFEGNEGEAEGSASKRPSVQVGDPFEEKRLIEASLDLLDQRLVVGIQDLGGAGLACATSETAARAGLGMEVDVSAVPLREEAMTPVEIMTSESQERMLAIVEPSVLERVLATCGRHEVRATVIGRVVEPDAAGQGMLVVLDGPGGDVLASVPAKSLADDAPLYDRPLAPPTDRVDAGPAARAAPGPAPWPFDPAEGLKAMLFDPGFVSRQYDHQLFLNTVRGPGEADATILKLSAPGIAWRGKGLALTCDANPGWCRVAPRLGAALTVAEAALNIACAGGRPVAVVDCMNFGNPEHPAVMWQLSEAVDGLAEACLALGVPVVGGNVSLYNESGGRDIDPTPVVGMVGIVDKLERRPPGIDLVAGDTLVLVGPSPALSRPCDGAEIPVLGGARWALDVLGEPGGLLPELDLVLHGDVCDVVRSLVAEGVPNGVHDVSDGGLALCLAELCCHSSMGIVAGGITTPAAVFSEAPSRVVLSVSPADVSRVLGECAGRGVSAAVLGSVAGGSLVVEDVLDVPVSELQAARSARLREAADAASR